jgi:hypothetical protein
MEANEEATGVELHKDSKFFASWQKFKDTNPVVNKFVDYRLVVVQCLEGAHFFQPSNIINRTGFVKYIKKISVNSI